MELLDELRNWNVWLLVLHLVPLLNVASLNLLYSFLFVSCLFGFVQLIPRPCSWGRRLEVILIDYDFCITIPRCYKDIYVNSFFRVTAKCRNSLPKECFPLTYDLNGFNSRINRHLLTVGSFLWLFRLAQSESKLKRRCYMAKKRASFWWLVVPKKEAICIILCQIVTVWCFR